MRESEARDPASTVGAPLGRGGRGGTGIRAAGDRIEETARGPTMPETQGTPAVLRREAVYRRGLALADMLSAALAVVGGVVLLGDDGLSPVTLAVLPVIVLVSKTLGLYDRDEHLLRKTTLDELPALFEVATLYALLLWLIEGALVQGSLGKGQVLSLLVLLFLSMSLARVAVRILARLALPPERCLVIGSAEAADWVRAKLAESPGISATVIGRIPGNSDSGEGLGSSAVPPAELRDLAERLGTLGVDRVILQPEGFDPDAVLHTVRVVKALGVRVSVLPRLFEVVGSSVEFDDLDGTILLGLRRYGLSRSSRVLKRATDLAGATVGLVLAAPVWLLAACAIKLSSPGPVLFRQRRIGRDGREFWMLKLRTMYDGADTEKPRLWGLSEGDGLFKLADDPRTTRVGRFLRRTSLDELPQLVNVLRGQMSLVGPRPLVPEEDIRVEGWQRGRLHLYPGMTGVWQVFGSARIPLGEMVKIDYLYAANWSLWLDCKILLRTIPHVLSRRGL